MNNHSSLFIKLTKTIRLDENNCLFAELQLSVWQHSVTTPVPATLPSAATHVGEHDLTVWVTELAAYVFTVIQKVHPDCVEAATVTAPVVPTLQLKWSARTYQSRRKLNKTHKMRNFNKKAIIITINKYIDCCDGDVNELYKSIITGCKF
ncbi:hypothetical protein BpHYR1_053713 [Brachionus plicatilis]|uniref:Uncharacterized protein n=1 Tax=Brachionus plicatilis TaxID=10195 RepID=A0A3M7T9N5_BRAPC|nr:hypothetical protein BpHYR1_053713 [Brachionus plicatilis]